MKIVNCFFIISQSLFLNNIVNAQTDQKDKLQLEVACYDASYTVDYGVNVIRPKFILDIRNSGMFPVKLNQQILFGHSNDDNQNDITFELFYLSGTDTINVLNEVSVKRGYRTNKKNILTINSTTGYFFEFTDLSGIYFKRSGRYKIRFTLLQKYAYEYMTKNISTDWIFFDVIVPARKESNVSD